MARSPKKTPASKARRGGKARRRTAGKKTTASKKTVSKSVASSRKRATAKTAASKSRAGAKHVADPRRRLAPPPGKEPRLRARRGAVALKGRDKQTLRVLVLVRPIRWRKRSPSPPELRLGPFRPAVTLLLLVSI